MSTKKIREALDILNDRLADDPDDIVSGALAEVEAIEKAATALQSGPSGVINDRAIDAWLDMGEAIAKEST